MTGNNALSPRLTPQISSTFVRFINSLMEAEGDDFRVDPNNIDFEEIQNKIRSLDPNLPLNNSFDFGSMPLCLSLQEIEYILSLKLLKIYPMK
jgi:hypothetical protein